MNLQVEKVALKTIKSKIRYRINRSKSTVFLPSDFYDISDRDQVIRALRQLCTEKALVKFGRGLYAKTRESQFTGKVIAAKPLPQLAREALTQKLGITVVPTSAQLKYNSGASTQVPTGRVIAIKGRTKRTMALEGKSITLINAS